MVAERDVGAKMAWYHQGSVRGPIPAEPAVQVMRQPAWSPCGSGWWGLPEVPPGQGPGDASASEGAFASCGCSQPLLPTAP